MKDSNGATVYYYNVDVQKADGTTKEKQGVISASDVSAAMNHIDCLAERWKATIRNCRIHTVDKDGELMLKTTAIPHSKKVSHSVKHPISPTTYGTQVEHTSFPLMKMEDTK